MLRLRRPAPNNFYHHWPSRNCFTKSSKPAGQVECLVHMSGCHMRSTVAIPTTNATIKIGIFDDMFKEKKLFSLVFCIHFVIKTAEASQFPRGRSQFTTLSAPNRSGAGVDCCLPRSDDHKDSNSPGRLGYTAIHWVAVDFVEILKLAVKAVKPMALIVVVNSWMSPRNVFTKWS